MVEYFMKLGDLVYSFLLVNVFNVDQVFPEFWIPGKIQVSLT